VNFAQIPGTQSRLIVSIDEAQGHRGDQPRYPHRLFAARLVCLFVLLGALIGAEKADHPADRDHDGMAKRFGEGDWSARVKRSAACRRSSCRWRALQCDGGAAQPARARDGGDQRTASL